MKKALSLILVLVLCLSLCACGGDKTTSKFNSKKTMEENIADGAKAYMKYSVDAKDGYSAAGSAEIQSVTPIKENKWFVMGRIPSSYRMNDGRKVTTSAGFSIIATYDQENSIFTYDTTYAGAFVEDSLTRAEKRMLTAAKQFVADYVHQGFSISVQQDEMEFYMAVIEENVWHLAVRIENSKIIYFDFLGTYDQEGDSFTFEIPPHQPSMDELNEK